MINFSTRQKRTMTELLMRMKYRPGQIYEEINKTFGESHQLFRSSQSCNGIRANTTTSFPPALALRFEEMTKVNDNLCDFFVIFYECIDQCRLQSVESF